MDAVAGTQLLEARLLRCSEHLLVWVGLWGDEAAPCVMKMSSAEEDATAKAQLRTEAQVLSLLQHLPGVPRLLHADAATGTLVQERAPGIALQEASVGLPRDVARWARVAVLLGDILDGIHRTGVLHGDVHPDNIMFDPATGQVTLIDFGAAVLQGRLDVGYRHPAQLGHALPYGARNSPAGSGARRTSAPITTRWARCCTTSSAGGRRSSKPIHWPCCMRC